MKIIKLVGLLALVLILMRQLSQDEWVDRWLAPVVHHKIGTLPFTNSQEENELPSNISSENVNVRSNAARTDVHLQDHQPTVRANPSEKIHSAAQPSIDPSPSTALQRLRDLQVSIWEQLLAECTPAEINDLGKLWFGTTGGDAVFSSGGEPTSNVGITERRLRSLDARLNEWESASQNVAQDSADHEAFQQFMIHWPTWRNWLSGPSADVLDELAIGDRNIFEQALDRLLLKTLRDAAPWRKVENSAFRRGLDLARSKQHQGSGGDLRVVETVSLMGDFGSYRGEWVRFRGTIADVPVKHSTDGGGFGPGDFWIVWLKPTDSSTQPICVYFVEQPPTSPIPMDGKSAEATSGEESILEVDARAMKKLAYASKQGVDVAPVLIASQARWIRADERNRPSSSLPEPRADRLVWKAPRSLRPLIDLLSQSFTAGRSEISPTLLEVLNRGGNQAVPSTMLRYMKQLERYHDLVDQVLAGEEPLPENLPLVERNAIVTAMQSVEVPDEHQGWFESSHCIRLTLQRDIIDDEPAIYAYVRSAPDFWKNQTRLLQPVRVQGLRVGGQRNQDSALLISKLLWTCWPEVQEAAEWVPPLPTNWLMLARRGWDLSEIDRLANLQTKPFDESESRPFYSLLRHATEWPSDSAHRTTPEAFMELLKNPKSRMLDELNLTLKVIRVTRVYVPEGKERSWAGTDEYFQIDGMADTGNFSVSMSGRGERKSVLFEGKYPVTLITTNLPSWLAHVEGSRFHADPLRNLDSADVWYPNVEVRARGIFYRLWGYSSQVTQSPEFSGKQFGPLLFATSILPNSPQSAEAIKSQLNWLNLIILLLSMGFVAWGWFMTRAKFAKKPVRFSVSDSPHSKVRQEGAKTTAIDALGGKSGSSQDS